jgi:hypothetical protein
MSDVNERPDAVVKAAVLVFATSLVVLLSALYFNTTKITSQRLALIEYDRNQAAETRISRLRGYRALHGDFFTSILFAAIATEWVSETGRREGSYILPDRLPSLPETEIHLEPYNGEISGLSNPTEIPSAFVERPARVVGAASGHGRRRARRKRP